MICDYCDRSNVTRAYCYFRVRTIAFTMITDQEFSLDSFAEYAISMELRWQISLCKELRHGKVIAFWQEIEPALRKALQASKT